MTHLISVVVPAYNGAATIDETLRSIRAQTHRALDIVVVDDGSRDDTVAIVSAHAAADPRVRLVQQQNAGVAAARNHGARVAYGDIVTFVDADDLCAPERMERQLAALLAQGDRAALSYTWSALIDGESVITNISQEPLFAGNVLEELCRRNFVGNGSSAMVRKAAFEEAGGYDPGLRARKAQGCEDLDLYIRIAERHEFAVAPAFLTGYRQSGSNMSSDVAQMHRSWKIVAADTLRRNPAMRDALIAGEKSSLAWLIGLALYGHRYRDALRLAVPLFRLSPHDAVLVVLWRPLRRKLRILRGRLLGRPAPAATPATYGRFPVGEVD